MAEEQHCEEASRHAELHDRLWTKLQDSKCKRSHARPTETQCRSPLRKRQSTTPSVEATPIDYASSREIQTSMQLLADQPPGTCYFNLALKKLLCHIVSHCITTPATVSTTHWLDDVCHHLRLAGADAMQEQTVAQQLRELARSTLSPFLRDNPRDDLQDVFMTATEDLVGQSTSGKRPAASPNSMEQDHSLSRADNVAGVANKRRRLEQPLLASSHAGSPMDKLRVLDLKTFMSSDLDQRKVLARRACSLPIELYFHHLRQANPLHATNAEQASLVWSKLTKSQTEQWEVLLERFRNGDVAAAHHDGADLLVEHEILQRLEPVGQSTVPCSSESTRPMHDSQQRQSQVSTRSKTRSQPVKSPYF